LRDGNAISTLLPFCGFEDAGGHQDGAITRTEFERFSIQVVKAPWKDKDAGFRTFKTSEPCDRFKDQFVCAHSRGLAALMVLLPWIARIKPRGGYDADVVRRRFVSKAC
jgi:hypothetical protein